MARTLYLCGHGGWKMTDGFIQVPQKCTFTFYSHAHKTIYQDAAEKIVAGKYQGWSDDFSEGQSIQNMTLYKADLINIMPTEIALKGNSDPNAAVFFLNYFGKEEMTLKELFQLYNIDACAPVHFVWTCCRYTEFREDQLVSQGKSGMNASEDLLRGNYVLRDFKRKILGTTKI